MGKGTVVIYIDRMAENKVAKLVKVRILDTRRPLRQFLSRWIKILGFNVSRILIS